jgi:hypothetical protein
MSALRELSGEKIHSRGIQIDIYSVDENSILVEGTLIDNRLREYYLLSGEKRDPGVIHHMIIRLLIEGPDLHIRDVEVEMLGIPRSQCVETINSLEPIKGLKIFSGFTAKVKSLIGGNRGCAHLVALLLAMAPAAVQGFWAQLSRKKVSFESPAEKERLSNFMVNTCWVWREDGPVLEQFREQLR